MTKNAESIVQKVVTAFLGAKERPTPEQVEEVMRPLAPDSFLYREEIPGLLRSHQDLYYAIDPWMEANMGVSGTGEAQRRTIQFLLMDTCTCVLDHLPKAIAHATGEVDQRIASLLNHKHFKHDAK